MVALSWITTLYVPAFSVFGAWLFILRLIVYPGPTVRVSVGVAECLADAPATSTAPTTTAVNIRIASFRMQTLLRIRTRRKELRGLRGVGFGQQPSRAPLRSAARGVAQPG